MPDTVISIEHVSKSYQLGSINTGTFYGDLKRWWARQRGHPDPYQKIGEVDHGNRRGETLWALKDINFQVQQGEALGIIGRNGAGKSTLLKILSRVTVPTSGEVKVKGRIASLLEVGTGFHPELTGRENVYLNGAIMGMNKTEISGKFDEIVDFSGVEQFIDTPVKRYSSGMYVRLAFAVAAHLEPEILIVDEVLAVGDAEFQKKCLGKMGDVAHEGRTVLFVSHNMAAIRKLCNRVILLKKGRIIEDNKADHIIMKYLASTIDIPAERIWQNMQQAPGDDAVRLKVVRVCDEAGNVVKEVDIRKPIGIQVEYWNLHSGLNPVVGLAVRNEEGVILFTTFDFTNTEWRKRYRPSGLVKATCWIPGNYLAEGRHYVQVAISSFSPATLDHLVESDALSFEVIDPGEGDSVRGDYSLKLQGVVRPMLPWNIEVEPADLKIVRIGSSK